MKRFLLPILLSLLFIHSHAQRQVFDLSRHWSFTPGWDVTSPSGTPVTLPHTWNQDALAGRPDYYRGLGNYVRILDVPQEWEGNRVYIRFEGANSVCDLYVNGKHAGQHRGGYTAFGWDISAYLNYGERNAVWARVSNAPDLSVLPIAGDYNIYGGLHRGAEIIVTPPVHISTSHYASPGVYITPTEVSREQASVNVNAVLEGAGGEIVTATFILRDGQNTPVDSVSRRITLDSRGSNRVAASFTIEQPRLWNGTADPYLYTMEVVVGSGKGADRVTQQFGLRSFTVGADNQFYLNGQPLRIQGVCRVEDWAGVGSALHRENHRRDVELMREMGVNAVRLTYYPNDDYFLTLCDRAGILVWSEIPFTGSDAYRSVGFSDSGPLRENAHTQLREMIHQQYNHPSVVWWGLYDQLSLRGEDPVELIRELNLTAKEVDGSRLTVAASNQDGEMNFITDLIGFNQMMGWSSGRPEGFDIWSRDLRREFPDLRSGVSKYGAGANVYQQTDTISRPDPRGAWHPEQWQTRLHEQVWSSIASRGGLWGTFVWSMFDSGEAHYTAGEQSGVNDCGLVTFDRSIRKDAFYFYKANWNIADPFVYICDRRRDERPAGEKQEIKVYSNGPEVELFVNGRSQGIAENDGLGRFVWKEVELQEGANTLEAVSPRYGARDRVTVAGSSRTLLPAPRQPAENRTGTANRRTTR